MNLKQNGSPAEKEFRGDAWVQSDPDARNRKALWAAILKYWDRIPPKRRNLSAVMDDFVIPNIDSTLEQALEPVDCGSNVGTV